MDTYIGKLPIANPLLPFKFEFAQLHYQFPSDIPSLPQFSNISRPPKNILNFDICDDEYFRQDVGVFRSLNELHINSTLVYQRFKCNKSKCFASPIGTHDGVFQDGDVQFDSNFECGNLLTAYRVSKKRYNLILQNDVGTTGCTDWYMFTVKCQERIMLNINIVNMRKQLKSGNDILLYSDRTGWIRGGDNVQSYRNRIISDGDSNQNYYTLSFNYQFEKNELVYFAKGYPYGVSTLHQYLTPITTLRNLVQCKQVQLIDNNECPILSVGNAEGPLVVLIGRQHPGDSSSSYVMEGMVNCITSNSNEGQILRSYYNFRILPMMCPDGVIHGNSRCNVQGVDLNRKWNKVNRLIGSVQYVKQLVKKHQNIHIGLDLQSSTKSGVYFRGNKQSNTQYVQISESVCKYIDNRHSRFSDDEGKYGKSFPNVLGALFNKHNYYTVGISSYYKSQSGIEYFTPDQFRAIGHQLCQALYIQCNNGNNIPQSLWQLPEQVIEASDHESDKSVSQILVKSAAKKKRDSRKSTSNENAFRIQHQQSIKVAPTKRISNIKPIKPLQEHYMTQVTDQEQQQQQRIQIKTIPAIVKQRNRSLSLRMPDLKLNKH